ncbi:MAG: adenosine kinase [Bdellovibrio sp.]
MKKYQVYGIGNALVDMEIEVSTKYLSEMGVKKGLMTLVDQQRQDQLLSKIDGHQHRRSCGGSAANTIIAVAQLGGKVFYSCKVANDEAGDFYLSDLRKNGVDTNLGDQRPQGITGKCMVFITPDADRTMNSFLGITESFSTNELNFDLLSQSEYLYMEGYLVTSATGKAAAIKAKEHARNNGVKVALTFSDPGIVGNFKSGFVEMIGDGVDLLFCNEAEALSFSGKSNFHEAVAELKKHTKSLAITRGPRGAYLLDGEKEIIIITKQVEAIDTNGAGDLFAGAFLWAITHGKTFAEAGELACRASSELVTRFGARLDKETLQAIKSSLFQ